MGVLDDPWVATDSTRVERAWPEGRDILEALDAAPWDEALAYFESRDGTRMLGVGALEELRFDAGPLASIARALPTHDVWIGGARFDPEREASEPWRPFGGAWFLRPAVLVVADAGGRARCFAAAGHEALAETLARGDVARPVQGGAVLPEAEAAQSEARWLAAFDAAIAAIHERVLDKVVLARCFEAEFPHAVPVGALLAASSSKAAARFRFALRPRAAATFVGMSPELLVRETKACIETEAVAGTMRSEASATLLADDKNRREHAFVADAIAAALRRNGAEAIERGEIATRCHGSLTHLVTPFVAHGAAPMRTWLADLHPTPAVCGHPRDVALDFIREREGFDRGFYSGFVGTLQNGEAEFAVALRCALLDAQRGRRHVYAGGGIVAGSDKNGEARELVDKIALWHEVLDQPR